MSHKVANISYYGSTNARSTEASLRNEFNSFLDGSAFEVSKKQLVLLRKFRRDDDNNLILCSCVDSVTGEPDKDQYCPISMGEKYLWDEQRIYVYKTVEDIENLPDQARQPGLLNTKVVVFYMRYDTSVTSADKIVEVGLDVEGQSVVPLSRTAVYRIQRLIDYRSDRGRIEYWKAICSQELTRFLNTPSIDD